MLKVMIAEDNIILADFLEDYLESQGFDVCGSAANVDAAVAMADLHKPDLAVIDFRLGDGEFGSQIVKKIKDKAALGVLYVSGDPLDQNLSRHDGEAYIQKPYGMNDIVRSLRIVRGMKTNNRIPDADFPRSFHLLEEPGPERLSA